MSNLKIDHPYLYKRVRLKAVLHAALGACLVFLPAAVPTGQTRGEVSALVTNALSFFGVIYLIIGILLMFGAYRARHDYKFARAALTLGCIYNTLWLALIFAILVDRPNRSTAYIAVLYGYLVYNLWLIRGDPGWRAVEIVKEGRRNGSST